MNHSRDSEGWPDDASDVPPRFSVRSEAGDDVPDVAAARDHVVSELVRFTRVLQQAGVDVPANAAIDGARVLVELGLDDQSSARAGLAAVLLGRESDRAAFERLFPEFWRRLRSGLVAAADNAQDEAPSPADRPDPVVAPFDADTPDDATTSSGDEDSDDDGSVSTGSATRDGDTWDPGREDERVETAVYSPVGRSKSVSARDAAAGIDDGLTAAVESILDVLGGRRGRRWSRGGVGAVDVRRALRRSFATGGTVVEIPERARRRDAVKTVVLVDVSQSVLDAVDRMYLLAFLREVSNSSRETRAFFFDTDLREVTDQIDAPSVGAAFAALERAEATWGGGTRIGHALQTVREDYPAAVDRTTTVFVVSDGLERGDVDVLESGMAWLSERAETVLWLNPLATSPRYEPTVRGMAVSLPYVDGLFAFAGPDDVEEIARQLELHWPGDGVGYEHDPRRRGLPGRSAGD